jgi:hypothetical protein
MKPTWEPCSNGALAEDPLTEVVATTIVRIAARPRVRINFTARGGERPSGRESVRAAGKVSARLAVLVGDVDSPGVNRHLVLIAVTCFASCVTASGAGAAAPTKASWAHAADLICRDGNAKIRALPLISSTVAVIFDLTKADQVGASEDAKLGKLRAPRDERGEIAALLADDRNTESVVRELLVPAIERDDPAAEAAANGQAEQLSARYNSLARKLGASICAASASPAG